MGQKKYFLFMMNLCQQDLPFHRPIFPRAYLFAVKLGNDKPIIVSHSNSVAMFPLVEKNKEVLLCLLKNHSAHGGISFGEEKHTFCLASDKTKFCFN